MNTTTKKLDTQLYNIFKEIYKDEDALKQAIAESKLAYSCIKQDALFRTMPNLYDELQ